MGDLHIIRQFTQFI